MRKTNELIPDYNGVLETNDVVLPTIFIVGQPVHHVLDQPRGLQKRFLLGFPRSLVFLREKGSEGFLDHYHRLLGPP